MSNARAKLLRTEENRGTIRDHHATERTKEVEGPTARLVRGRRTAPPKELRAVIPFPRPTQRLSELTP
eukprot:8879240-Pyramimonas_sp.AAC.1